MRTLFFNILLLSIFACTQVKAQTYGTRDCINAATLCSNQTIYDTIVSPSPGGGGIIGNVNDIPSGMGTSCFNKSERRPFWYQFTAETSGTFEMFIEDDIGGDWDFVVYDKNNGCGQGNWIELACNASDDICNNTGVSTDRFNSWTPMCATVNPWHPSLNLTAGRTYVIFINGADTRVGDVFTLSFGGTVEFRDIEANFTSSQNPTCLGTAVNFTNTSTYPAGNTNFSWDFGDGNTATTQHATHTYDSPGTYVVNLIVDNGYCMDEHSMEVIISPVDHAVIGPDQAICYGTSANLSAGGGVSYSWSPAESLNDPNIANPIATPSSTTEYTVRVTDEIGCVDSANVTINVTFIPVNAGEDQTICQLESAQLNATGGTSFAWSPDDGSLSNTGVQNPLASPSTTTEYIVTVTDEIGCVNYDTLTVHVNELPIADAGSDQSICYGTDTQLSASGGLSYSWTPVGSLNDPNSQNPTSTPSATTTYTVTVTDENNCSNTDEVTVEVTYIDVDAGEEQTICNGLSAQLEASGGISYNWTPDNGSLDDVTIANPLATPSVATQYNVTVTDENGCINFDSVVVNVTYINIEAGENQTICEGESVQLNATGGVSYTWAPDDGTLSNPGIHNPVATPSVTTEYIVTMTDENGCINTDTLTIFVNPLPLADAGDDVTICNGLTTQLNASGGGSYSWSPDESLNDAGIANPIASPTVPTTYTLTVTDASNCSNTDEVTVNVTYIDVDAGGDQTICNGVSAQLEATGGETYSWNPDNGSLNNITISNPLASPSATTEYVVTVTDEFGCINTDTVTVNVTYIDVDAGNDETICEGESVQLSVSEGASYSWMPSDGSLDDTSIQNPVATPSATTEYIVTVTDADGCINSDTVTVNVNLLPTAYAGDDQTICNGISAQLEASGGETYIWTPDNGSLNNIAISNPLASPSTTT
ncbi:MAG: PKD domain-containing protein, partial [Cytophagaceae bacterium]